MPWSCNDCGDVFDEPVWRKEYVDDSSKPAYSTMHCPTCGSEDIEEYIEDEEDETD